MESAGNANKPYIFVSFTGEDEENVNEFCAELRRRNINAVTYESKDSEAAFGKNFADWRQFFLNRTQDKRCLAVVCFFTRQYFAHRATLEEICMLLEAADQFPPVYGFCPAGKRPDQFIDEIADYSNKNRGKNPFRSGPDHTYFVRHEERLRKLFDSHNIVIDSAADLVARCGPFFRRPPKRERPPGPRAARLTPIWPIFYASYAPTPNWRAPRAKGQSWPRRCDAATQARPSTISSAETPYSVFICGLRKARRPGNWNAERKTSPVTCATTACVSALTPSATRRMPTYPAPIAGL